MGGRTAWGQLIPTPDGHYIQLYEDGSITVYDQMFNVTNDDPTPNPQRSALIRAGRVNDAAINAAQQALSTENTRRFNLGQKNTSRGLDQRQREIENTYKINLMNARTNQDVANANAQLARDRLQFDRETQQFNAGMRGVELQANLRGSQNYFQASQAAHNFSQLPGSETFLSSVRSGLRLPGFGAQGAAPAAATVGGLVSNLANGGATYPTTTAPNGGVTGTVGAAAMPSASGGYADTNALLNQTHAIAQAGGGRVGAGVLETLSPDDLGLLQSGIEAPDEQGNAYNWSSFLDQHRRSRIGQSIGQNYRAA